MYYVAHFLARFQTASTYLFKFTLYPLSPQLYRICFSVDRKKEDERIDNTENINHCEANEATHQRPEIVQERSHYNY